VLIDRDASVIGAADSGAHVRRHQVPNGCCRRLRHR
jgi:hypothetical protein